MGGFNRLKFHRCTAPQEQGGRTNFNRLKFCTAVAEAGPRRGAPIAP